MYSCLSTTYYNCFNPVYLISQGHGLRNSFIFTAEVLRTQFKCVGGFERMCFHKRIASLLSEYANFQRALRSTIVLWLVWIIRLLKINVLVLSIKRWTAILVKYASMLRFYSNSKCIDQIRFDTMSILHWNEPSLNNASSRSEKSDTTCYRAVQNLTACYMNLFANCGNQVQWWICEDLRVGFALFTCPDLRCNVIALLNNTDTTLN